MTKRQRVFVPTIEEDEWIDEHVSSWSDHCRESILWKRKKLRQQFYDRMTNSFILIMLGLLLAMITYVVPNVIFSTILYFSSGFCVVFGFYMVFSKVRT